MKTRIHHRRLTRCDLTEAGSIRDIPELLQLWVLRVLHNAVCDRVARISPTENDLIYNALDIPAKPVKDSRTDDYLCKHLARRCSGLLRKRPGLNALGKHLGENVARLANLIGLNPTEQLVLAFAVLLRRSKWLCGSTELYGDIDNMQATRLLAVALDLPEAEITGALSPRGRLGRCALVKMDSNHTVMASKLDLISREFPDHMCLPCTDELELIGDIARRAPAATLTWTDFTFLGRPAQLVEAHLRDSLSRGKPGANVLLYGPPGTGKTQFVRSLTESLGIQLFEVTCEDQDGDPIDGERRARALAAAQNIFRNRNAVLLFDEIEDVFPKPSPNPWRSLGSTCKGWINRILEDNAVPTIWVSNCIDSVDPAYLRRFDVVLEIPNPPREIRRSIISKSAPSLSETTINRLVEVPSLTPAVVSRAVGVAEGTRRTSLPSGQIDTDVELLVDNVLRAQSLRTIGASAATLPGFYNPDYVNADINLSSLTTTLRASKTGARLCLYGPPGTGKTAFGRWLAGMLGRPLLVRRASDLLSQYVGLSEKNIAAAFAEATQTGALLLIDEVDSFLQDRSKAVRSWEVTIVNELLTQMEAFAGVFVASTNLMRDLDAASLRRFDMKICFGYLRADQAASLLSEHLKAAGLPTPTERDLGDLARLDTLTPGDFAAVARRSRFDPLALPADWTAALSAECALKAPVSRPVGFAAGF